MSYNTSFGLTSVTGPHGANQSANYDDYNRPSSATSVAGAVTNYTYTYAPNTQTATISMIG
jgi:YD repeat-containing protein